MPRKKRIRKLPTLPKRPIRPKISRRRRKQMRIEHLQQLAEQRKLVESGCVLEKPERQASYRFRQQAMAAELAAKGRQLSWPLAWRVGR